MQGINCLRNITNCAFINEDNGSFWRNLFQHYYLFLIYLQVAQIDHPFALALDNSFLEVFKERPYVFDLVRVIPDERLEDTQQGEGVQSALSQSLDAVEGQELLAAKGHEGQRQGPKVSQHQLVKYRCKRNVECSRFHLHLDLLQRQLLKQFQLSESLRGLLGQVQINYRELLDVSLLPQLPIEPLDTLSRHVALLDVKLLNGPLIRLYYGVHELLIVIGQLEYVPQSDSPQFHAGERRHWEILDLEANLVED